MKTLEHIIDDILSDEFSEFDYIEPNEKDQGKALEYQVYLWSQSTFPTIKLYYERYSHKNTRYVKIITEAYLIQNPIVLP